MSKIILTIYLSCHWNIIGYYYTLRFVMAFFLVREYWSVLKLYFFLLAWTWFFENKFGSKNNTDSKNRKVSFLLYSNLPYGIYVWTFFKHFFLNEEVVPYLAFHRFKKNSSASTRLRFFLPKSGRHKSLKLIN